jgi:ATP-dependent protease ClpP protease subunit
MTTQPQPPPENAYGIFCGDINSQTTQKLVNNLTLASNLGVKNVHILFQSWGGFVGDGIFLYNLLRTFPLPVTLYNGGQVASAGVLAFLGARNRKTTKNALFMIHKTQNSPQQPITIYKLRAISKALILDDARVDAIFRELRLPEEIWVDLSSNDINIPGEDAITYGIADGLGEFSPPCDCKVFNALG